MSRVCPGNVSYPGLLSRSFSRFVPVFLRLSPGVCSGVCPAEECECRVVTSLTVGQIHGSCSGSICAVKPEKEPDRPGITRPVPVSVFGAKRNPHPGFKMPGLSALVLLSLCLNLHTCRGFPNKLPELSASLPGHFSFTDPLLDYDRLDEELGGGGGRNGTGGRTEEGCGPCEPDLCPETRSCRAGLVLDSCGCCKECGNLEGQACDPGDRSVYYGLCGTGMRCRADPRLAGGVEEDEEEEEEVCVCEEQEAVCGSDGVTYMNMCQFREAAFSRPELQTRGRGPCKTVPIIKVPPHSQVNGTGSSLVFLCEVFAFPMALVEWRKEGQDVVLPGDDPHISVQSRGGPLKFELSSWLQIEGAGLEDSGTYRCIARNNLGSVSASAVLGVLGAEELSTYLANSVSEMKQLMDATDYDQDFY